jgi:S-adenosylmethionine/arginine decarboxylase-like enzyme
MLKHQHLIIRAEIANPPYEEDLDYMHVWFKDLIESINMKILSGPHVVYCNMPGNRGFTGVCCIETSHIAMHIWDEDNPSIIQLDVYTCSTLDIDVVFNKMKRFTPKLIDYTYIDRDNKLEIIGGGKFKYE